MSRGSQGSDVPYPRSERCEPSDQSACLVRWPSRRTLALAATSRIVEPMTSGFGFVLCPAGCTTRSITPAHRLLRPDVVIDTMDRLVPEQAAQVVVSTAHKAKGREWPRVRIADDFHQPKGEDTPIPQAEAMLAYVAVTRARLALDPDGLAWVDRWLATRPAPAPEPALSPPGPTREPITAGREVGHER